MISLLKLTQKQVIAIVAILGLIGTGYFYFRYRQAKLQNTIELASAEKQKLLDKIGKFIELPNDEEPTVATVTDVGKLKDQPFFAKAKNGDKVIIYTNAKKAILYDPNAGKIIDFAPINIGSPAATANTITPTNQPSPSPLSPTITPVVTATPKIEATEPVTPTGSEIKQ